MAADCDADFLEPVAACDEAADLGTATMSQAITPVIVQCRARERGGGAELLTGTTSATAT